MRPQRNGRPARGDVIVMEPRTMLRTAITGTLVAAAMLGYSVVDGRT